MENIDFKTHCSRVIQVHEQCILRLSFILGVRFIPLYDQLLSDPFICELSLCLASKGDGFAHSCKAKAMIVYLLWEPNHLSSRYIYIHIPGVLSLANATNLRLGIS